MFDETYSSGMLKAIALSYKLEWFYFIFTTVMLFSTALVMLMVSVLAHSRSLCFFPPPRCCTSSPSHPFISFAIGLWVLLLSVIEFEWLYSWLNCYWSYSACCCFRIILTIHMLSLSLYLYVDIQHTYIWYAVLLPFRLPPLSKRQSHNTCAVIRYSIRAPPKIAYM